jgi:hypothetical protein
MFRSVLLFLFSFYSVKAGFAFSAAPDSSRTLYVSAFERDFNIGPAIKYRIPVITINSGSGSKVTYRPNNNYIAGIRIHVFGLQFQLATSLEPGTSSLSRYGKTKANEFSFNYMSHKWFGDLNLYRYEGLWYKNSGEDYRGKPFPSRKDLVMSSKSVSATHLFNSKKFSMRAPYAFNEHQVKSGGSWLIRMNINQFVFSGNETLIDDAFISDFTELSSVNEVTFSGIGIAPGYSYNFIHKDYFLNGIITAGPSHYWIRYEEIDLPTRYDIQFNFVTTVGMAAGYNGDRFFGGVTWRSQGFRLKREQAGISGNQNVFMVTAGFRLHEDGIFKKRIKDLIPENLKHHSHSTN